MTWLWAIALAVSVFAAHWGAEQLANPLQKARRQWGLTAAAGGAVVGLASAAPDIGINTASAIQGAAEIGLGNMLGSNVVSIPGMVVVAYLGTRSRQIGDGDGPPEDHDRHVERHHLELAPSAVWVQAAPYLAIVVLAAVLILPAPLRGLQPVDGAIMAVAYLAYLAQALLRGRSDRKDVEWSRREAALASAGVAVLAVASYFITTSTQRLASAFGIEDVVAGLFLTATMTAVPAWFATWAVARSGQVVSAATNSIADNTVALTVGFLPLALVGVPVQNPALVTVTFAFVALMPILYAAAVHFGRDHAITRAGVAALVAAHLGFVTAAAVTIV